MPVDSVLEKEFPPKEGNAVIGMWVAYVIFPALYDFFLQPHFSPNSSRNLESIIIVSM